MSALILASLFLIGYVLVLLLFFKANAGVMFLAACSGLVLLASIDPTVITTAGAVVPSEGEAYVRLSVVLLSMLFAAMMFRKAWNSVDAFLHVAIGLLTAVMLLLILPETTGVSWLVDASREPLWQDLDDFRSLIVATGFGLSLAAVLMTTKKSPKKHKR